MFHFGKEQIGIFCEKILEILLFLDVFFRFPPPPPPSFPPSPSWKIDLKTFSLKVTEGCCTRKQQQQQQQKQKPSPQISTFCIFSSFSFMGSGIRVHWPDTNGGRKEEEGEGGGGEKSPSFAVKWNKKKLKTCNAEEGEEGGHQRKKKSHFF